MFLVFTRNRHSLYYCHFNTVVLLGGGHLAVELLDHEIQVLEVNVAVVNYDIFSVNSFHLRVIQNSQNEGHIFKVFFFL